MKRLRDLTGMDIATVLAIAAAVVTWVVVLITCEVL